MVSLLHLECRQKVDYDWTLIGDNNKNHASECTPGLENQSYPPLCGIDDASDSWHAPNLTIHGFHKLIGLAGLVPEQWRDCKRSFWYLSMVPQLDRMSTSLFLCFQHRTWWTAYLQDRWLGVASQRQTAKRVPIILENDLLIRVTNCQNIEVIQASPLYYRPGIILSTSAHILVLVSLRTNTIGAMMVWYLHAVFPVLGAPIECN